jgi:hypothetical protein
MNKKRVKVLKEEFFEKFGPVVGCRRHGNEILEKNEFRRFKKEYSKGRKRK